MEENKNNVVGNVNTQATQAGAERDKSQSNSTSGVVSKVPKKGEDVNIKYKGLSYEMASEIQYYEDNYVTWDKPIPFGEKLMIYPATLSEYNDFFECLACFLLNRKDIPQGTSIADVKKRMKMSDLEFLMSNVNAETLEGQVWGNKLVRLLEIIFHIKNGIKCDGCQKKLSIEEYKQCVAKAVQEAQKNTEKLQIPAVTCPECGSDKLTQIIDYVEDKEQHKFELIIDGQVINSKDFIRLKNIVLFQNLPDYRDTSYVDPNLKKDYETRKALLNKNKENLTATLEKKIVALKIGAGYSNYEDIYKLTVRKFLMEMTTMDDLIMYKLLTQGQLCGLGGGSKEPIEHWIYKKEQDVYADGGYVSKDAMTDKIKSAH